MQNRTILACAAVGSLVAAALIGPAVQADVTQTAPGGHSVSAGDTNGTDCITRDASGRRVWFGEANTSVNALADALQAIVDEHTDQTTGVALCSHYEGAAIYVVSPSDDVHQSIAEVASKFPDLQVITRTTTASISQLFAAGGKLLKSPDMQGLVMGVGPDMHSGGLRITVAPDKWPLPENEKRRIDDAVEAINGSPRPLTYRQGGHVELSTRAADTAPYWMGGELVYGNDWCSSGVPIIISGVRRLLTAGHCTGPSFYNNGNLVGTTYTTSYPGNAYFLGDWQLIQGSTYSARVFNGPLNSTSSLPISGGVWGGLPEGRQICTSGRTTAQTCRYYVLDSYSAVNVGGVMTGPVLEMYHDSSGTGTGADSNGWMPGDSGGPCYYADGSGGVMAAGIVTAREVGLFSTIYYCTQLTGVHSWNSSITVG